MKAKTLKELSILAVLLLALAFVIRFSGAKTLKLYVESGVGDCQKNPILCLVPEKEINQLEIDKEFYGSLLPYKFSDMEVGLPKGFTVVKEKVKKVYYKKHKRMDKGAVAYLLYQPPKFFMNLFPDLYRQGCKDDYDFLNRLMNAVPDKINGVTGAFLVVTKGVFTPDLGSQKDAHIIKFALAGRRGFVSYNLDSAGNYFDCNIVDADGNFFKIYLKDKGATLDLDKVLTVISTVKTRD